MSISRRSLLTGLVLSPAAPAFAIKQEAALSLADIIHHQAGLMGLEADTSSLGSAEWSFDESQDQIVVWDNDKGVWQCTPFS